MNFKWQVENGTLLDTRFVYQHDPERDELTN